MKRNRLNYDIVHPYDEEINPEEDFVDIEVNFEGKKYVGSVTTTKFIDSRMKNYEMTGENSHGNYFCAPGMLILKRIDKKTIKNTLDDLRERGDLEKFLES